MKTSKTSPDILRSPTNLPVRLGGAQRNKLHDDVHSQYQAFVCAQNITTMPKAALPKTGNPENVDRGIADCNKLYLSERWKLSRKSKNALNQLVPEQQNKHWKEITWVMAYCDTKDVLSLHFVEKVGYGILSSLLWAI